jgi:hypothetical protein
MGDGVKVNRTRIGEFAVITGPEAPALNLMPGRMPSERLLAEPVPMAILGNTPVRVMRASSQIQKERAWQ